MLFKSYKYPLGTLPGSYIVDVLPFLDTLPMFLKPWERNSKARFRRDLEWCMERLNVRDSVYIPVLFSICSPSI